MHQLQQVIKVEWIRVAEEHVSVNRGSYLQRKRKIYEDALHRYACEIFQPDKPLTMLWEVPGMKNVS